MKTEKAFVSYFFDFRDPENIRRANEWGKSLSGKECTGCNAIFCPARGYLPREEK